MATTGVITIAATYQHFMSILTTNSRICGITEMKFAHLRKTEPLATVVKCILADLKFKDIPGVEAGLLKTYAIGCGGGKKVLFS